MDASSTNQLNVGSTIRVRDPKTLLWTILGLIVLVPLTLILNVSNSEDIDLDSILLYIVFNLPLLIMLYRLKAIWSGIELDIDNRVMSFMGGGISANDFVDYFKPDFLLQYFKRFVINIDEISQISAENDRTMIWSPHLKEYIVSWTYTINFIGTFGSASVKFANEGKRDQIYNLIRQLNQMGEPFVKAN